MASEVSVINVALVDLGVATISARSDDSPQARIANRTFDEIRDDLLREHTWNWATKRRSLPASTTAPDWEFTNAFVVPSDYLRLVEINNPSKYEFRIESTADGRVIVTDLAAPLEIAYVARISDVSQWDVKFNMAMSKRCALEWAESLTGVSTLAERLQGEYQAALKAAKAVESQEDSVREIDVTPWISSRY